MARAPDDPEQVRWRSIAASRSERNAFCASISVQKYPVIKRQGAVLDRIEAGPMKIHRRSQPRRR